MTFPGAEGFGQYTSAECGGEIYIATNQNDSGWREWKTELIQSKANYDIVK
ncbi:MAG: hypothetical protein V8S95_04455 [Odoribacter sp.]